MTINILLDDKKINLKHIKKISFILIYSLFSFYFLINGSGLFDDWSSNWTSSTLIYLVGVSLFLGIQEKLPKDLESPILKSLVGFCMAFMLSTGLFLVLYDAGLYFQDVTPIASNKVLALFVYQLVIVCTSEEIIFRGVIYRFFRQFNVYIGVFISSIIFALFHFVAYGGNLGAMMIAFLMGCILALCMERWNIGVSISVHFAWNCFILGITCLI